MAHPPRAQGGVRFVPEGSTVLESLIKEKTMLRKTLVGMAAALALCAGSASALAQGTAFTYQGQLKNSGAAVGVASDMQFSLWNHPTLSAPANQVGSTVTNLNVAVSQGLFATPVDFGVNPYTSSQTLYLQIAVRPSSTGPGGAYTPMGTRQALTPAPFSLATRGVNVDAVGNVGIGTSMPNASLEVDRSAVGGGKVLQLQNSWPSWNTQSDFNSYRFIQTASPIATDGNWKALHVGAGGVSIGYPNTPVYNSTDALYVNGNVGIGTNNPQRKLDIQGGRLRVNNSEGNGNSVIEISNDSATNIIQTDALVNSAGTYNLQIYTHVGGAVNLQPGGGNVGIGTYTPGARLSFGTYTNATAPTIALWESNGAGMTGIGMEGGAMNFWAGGAVKAKVRNDGVFEVKTLQIDGGSDLVEGFDSQAKDIEPGTLMVIDPAHPGQLMPSTSAYDSKVAGIVSGAGGVKAGIHMGQDGVMDGKNPIAMTGRVYVKATAANGAIKPGDLLTTSDLAGHAMKASDENTKRGVVIGKAMSGLDKDTGLVLVLVNLQ